MKFFFQENTFENVICNMVIILILSLVIYVVEYQYAVIIILICLSASDVWHLITWLVDSGYQASTLGIINTPHCCNNLVGLRGTNTSWIRDKDISWISVILEYLNNDC